MQGHDEAMAGMRKQVGAATLGVGGAKCGGMGSGEGEIR